MIHTIKKILLMSSNLQGKQQKFYLHTTFYKPNSQPDRLPTDFLLAELHMLTANNSYHSIVKRKHVNKEITFNNDFINRLQTIFAGKCPNFMIVSIQDHGYDGKILVVGSQLETRMIRVILFESPLQQLPDKPFPLMRKLMNFLNEQKQFILACSKTKQQKQREKLDEIDQVHNQLKQSYKDETNIIKQKFIPTINHIKKQLVRQFGLDANFNKQTQEQQKLKKANQNLIYQRQFYKINEKAMEKVGFNDKNGVQDLFA